MNNIEILEEFLEQYNASYPEEKEWVAIYPNQIEAIENLIQENKELKEKAYKKEYYEEVADVLYKDSIPKSKVKEKIEYYHHKDFIKVQVCYQHDNEARIKEEALRELLEEGE